MSSFKLIALISIFFLFSLSFVQAIGISPPRVTEDFVSGESLTVPFQIINRAHPTYVKMDAFGSPLAEFVTFSQDSFSMPQGVVSVDVSVDFPEFSELVDSFGRQIIRIRASESPDTVDGSFAAVTSVVGWLVIEVPVPGEFAEIVEISDPTVLEGEDVLVDILLRNRGTQPLSNKQLDIQVLDVLNQPVYQTTVSSIAVPLDDSTLIQVALPSSSFDPGKYTFEVLFNYSDEMQPLVSSRSFFVGATDIQLINYTQTLEEGSINRVRFHLQSLWGSPLRSVRPQLLSFSGEQSLPVLDFDPFQLQVLEAFIEVPSLESLDSDTFDSMLRLEFPVDATTDTTKEFPVTFLIAPQEDDVLISFNWYFVAVILIVAISGIVFFVIRRWNHEKR